MLCSECIVVQHYENPSTYFRTCPSFSCCMQTRNHSRLVDKWSLIGSYRSSEGSRDWEGNEDAENVSDILTMKMLAYNSTIQIPQEIRPSPLQNNIKFPNATEFMMFQALLTLRKCSGMRKTALNVEAQRTHTHLYPGAKSTQETVSWGKYW